MTRAIRASEAIDAMSREIARRLHEHALRIRPPDAQKRDLRSFSSKETAAFLGLSYSTFRSYLAGKRQADVLPLGDPPPGGRRQFSADDIAAIRDALYEHGLVPPERWRRRKDGEPLQVLTVSNLKGGVAKTATAASLAHALGMRGWRVLVIDLDAQASVTNFFGLDPIADDTLPTIHDAIRIDQSQKPRLPMADVVQPSYFPNIDIAAGSLDITTFEFDTAAFASTLGRGDTPWYMLLSDAIAQVEGAYDLVIVDTPPQVSFSVISALFCTTGMLIPIQASFVDVRAFSAYQSILTDLMATVEGHQGQPREFDFIRFLITRYRPNDQAQFNIATFLRATLGEAVLRSEFLESTAVSDAAINKNTIVEADISEFTRKTYERAYDSVSAIADEVETLLFEAWGRAHGT